MHQLAAGIGGDAAWTLPISGGRTYGQAVRELRYVGPGDDGSVILENPESGKQFSLVVDDKIIAAMGIGAPDQARSEQPTSGEEAVIDLRPRDIQMRVRAGEDPQAIAEEAGVSLDKVMRFAYPVLAERQRVVDEARRGRARNGEGHAVPFGELFDARVASLGAEPTGVRWDAVRRPDGGWTVTAVFTARTYGAEDTELAARFSFALLNRTVSALNDTASDLLSGRPLKALQPPEPEELPGPPSLTAVPSPDDALDIGSTNPRSDTGAGSASNAPSELRPPIRLPSRRLKSHTHPIPVRLDEDLADELFDQEALDPTGDTGWHEPPLPLDLGLAHPAPPETARHETVQQETARPETARPDTARPDTAHPETAHPETAHPETAQHEPAQHEPAQHEPGTDAPLETPHKRGRAGDKPRMPSWDDILLGVRRKSE
jgi:hypothetical protein